MSEHLPLLPFDLMLAIYLIAIAAEAMSGALAAGRRDMDIFGVAVIAFVPRSAAAPCATSFSATTRSAGPSIRNMSTW